LRLLGCCWQPKATCATTCASTCATTCASCIRNNIVCMYSLYITASQITLFYMHHCSVQLNWISLFLGLYNILIYMTCLTSVEIHVQCNHIIVH
jgi:hypothetical protein